MTMNIMDFQYQNPTDCRLQKHSTDFELRKQNENLPLKVQSGSVQTAECVLNTRGKGYDRARISSVQRPTFQHVTLRGLHSSLSICK